MTQGIPLDQFPKNSFFCFATVFVYNEKHDSSIMSNEKTNFNKISKTGLAPSQTDLVNKDSRYLFLIGIHSLHGLTATTRHGVARKRSTKRLKHTANLFKKNLLVCKI